jgi:Fibronectin type III domain
VVEVTDNLSAGNTTALSSNFSGYSADGGSSWQVFPSIAAATHPCILYFGSIAVSARAAGHINDPPGNDNLVWIPSNYNDFSIFAQGPAPFYSKDGGATWTQTQSFNAAPGAIQRTECPSNTAYTYMGFQWGPWIFALSQHLLVADPVTPGTFYADLTAGGFWKSTDGGVTWTQEPATNAPNYPHHGTLATVPGVSGDMWLVDGNGGASSHGLFHTLDGGNSFTRSPVFDYAWTLALGKPATGKTYPSIYVYGLYHGDANWGIFQSLDSGVTFNRVAYYPDGILDIPNTMTASWDVFGTVYIGFAGNTFYYGTFTGSIATSPGAPTLTAAVANTTANLTWSPGSGGTPTGFSLYRGTASGQESSTPIATLDATTSSWQDTGLTPGTTYYYDLTAANASGTSPNSNEVSAAIAPAGLALGAATNGSLSVTVKAGGTATFNLALTSVNYAGTVTYTCTGAPAGDTCTSAPSASTLTPATTLTPLTITVQTASSAAALVAQNRQGLAILLWPIGLLAVPLGLRRGRRRTIAAVFLTTALLAGISACGSSSQPVATNTTVTLTVTATGTAGIAPATATLTLTIHQ